MKVKDPISLDQILDFYMQDISLSRPPAQLLAEFKDLMKITDFLESGIPFRLKSIRNKFNQSKKNLKDVYNDLDNTLHEVKDSQRQMRLSMNPRLGYEIFCRLSQQDDQLRDYRQQFSEKQMKLKFLSSRSLIPNLKWRNIFDTKTNKLQINHKKYCMYIGLQILIGSPGYIWNIHRIEQISIKKSLQHLIDFYNKKMRPQNIKNHPENHQQYSLSWMIKYLSFLEQLETKRYVMQFLGIPTNIQNALKFTHKSIKYCFKFTKPQSDPFPIITITTPNYPNFLFTIDYTNAKLLATITDQNQIYTCSGFVFENIKSFLEKLGVLFNILEKKSKFRQIYPLFYEQVRDNFVIIWGGFFFMYTQCKFELKGMDIAFKLRNQGFFLVQYLYQKYLCVEISFKGKPFSLKASEQFINRLIEKFPPNNAKTLFSFIYIIQYFLQDNQNCNVFSLTDYNITRPLPINANYVRPSPSLHPLQSPYQPQSPNQVNLAILPSSQEYKIQLRFKKRILYEQWMLRSSFRQHNSDSYNFIVITIRVQFQLNFTGVAMKGTVASNKDEPIESYKLPQYTIMMENKKPTEKLDMKVVLKQIDYLRNHATLLKFHESKLANQIKAKTKLNMNES